MPSKLFSLPWDSALLNSLNGQAPAKQSKSTSPVASSTNLPSTKSTHPTSRSSMDHLRRPGLGLTKKHGSSDRNKDRSLSKDAQGHNESRAPQSRPVAIHLVMESPPALMIDTPEHSSGVLISGRLQVSPLASDVSLKSITMYLECTTHHKRPIHDRCRACATQVNDLFEWHFLTKPTTFPLATGQQDLPFSHLIPGHLPATTHGQIATIEYSLHVRAHTTSGTEIEARRALNIQRALRPAADKNSIRIFPPTNLTLHVTLPNIIHPIGEFPVLCRMTGISSTRPEDNAQLRWRLRKLTWRIEERETSISPACATHSAAKLGSEHKGMHHESVRDIGFGELKSGWKTDLSPADAVIEGEFPANIDPSAVAQCAVSAPNGFKITHNLILELVIAEECVLPKKPNTPLPTGAARVLRTQFALNLTHRAGMGIAWDDEMPPTYEDVPDSPPHYAVPRGDGREREGVEVTTVMREFVVEREADVESLALDS